MPEFDYARAWKNEKTAFERSTGRKKPSPTFLGMTRGVGIDSALQKFDRARDLKARQKAYQGFVRVKSSYETLLTKAKKEAGDRMLQQKVGDLQARLRDLQNRMEQQINTELTSAPKAVGRVVPMQIVRRFDLVAGIASDHLQLTPMWVDAHLEIDKAWEHLVDNQREGFKLATLGDEAKKVADRWRSAIAATVSKVDAHITKLILQSPKDLSVQVERKRAEVADVLRQSQQRATREMNEAVQKTWTRMQGRKEALKSTRITIAIGSAAGGVNLAVQSALIVATGGATIVGVASMAKSVVDMAHAMGDALKDLHQVEEELVGQLQTLSTLGGRKERGFFKDHPQFSKAVVGTDELAAWMSYAAFTKLPSFTRAQYLLGDFNGKVSQTESRMDTLVGRLNKLLTAIDKADRKIASTNKLSKKTRYEDQLALMRVEVVTMLDAMGDLSKKIRERVKRSGEHEAFLRDLQTLDIHQPAVMKTGQVGMVGATVGGAAWSLSDLVTALV